jgi:hypothetical protein
MAYAHPEVLVTTDWLAENLTDPILRIIEVDEDVLLFEQGHVPGAQKVDWHTDLQREDIRDFIDAQGFEALMSRLGVSNDSTVVLYGDKNNWWAAYAFWFFKYNGHQNVRLVNGGRAKWVAEGRELSRDVKTYPTTTYRVPYRDASIRAFQPDVLKHLLRVSQGAGATSPAPAASPGRRRPTPTAPSRMLPNCVNCTRARALLRTRTWSSTVASPSVPATAGSSSSTSSATRTCATTTDPGRSGATWSEFPSRRGLGEATETGGGSGA